MSPVHVSSKMSPIHFSGITPKNVGLGILNTASKSACSVMDSPSLLLKYAFSFDDKNCLFKDEESAPYTGSS